MAFSFSVIEILPSVLNKTKTQTIRPIPKNGKPRATVGSVHKLFWKQRSQYKLFCIKCGAGRTKKTWWKCKGCGDLESPFNKILGEAEITEVFEIEMYYKPCRWGKACIINLKDSLFSEREKIAKLDGFKDTVEMFKYFDKHYDISTPKRFYVYRFKWRCNSIRMENKSVVVSTGDKTLNEFIPPRPGESNIIPPSKDGGF